MESFIESNLGLNEINNTPFIESIESLTKEIHDLLWCNGVIGGAWIFLFIVIIAIIINRR
ncbi:hypothetical protein AB832_07560 [Flavobacteriaceae bacterium (ex Bugula neritina AB1)]|nr:hypothetical protein AB832_07560 [Flavobacteriaceae bacterium (ex Bugula neritina AB1)]